MVEGKSLRLRGPRFRSVALTDHREQRQHDQCTGGRFGNLSGELGYLDWTVSGRHSTAGGIHALNDFLGDEKITGAGRPGWEREGDGLVVVAHYAVHVRTVRE